ncbi:MAG: cytochrome c oxidase subunit II [Actinomycetes bacterium]
MNDLANSTDCAIEPTSKTRRSRKGLGWIALAIAPILLSGCQIPGFGINTGVTESSHKVYKLWQGFMVTGLIVGGFTFLLIVYAAIRYRRRSNEIPRQTQYNTLVEVLYTVIPTIIVAGLFYFTIVVENPEVALVQSPPAKVKVVAFQWGWRFSYPENPKVNVVGQTTENPELVLPVGETVQIDLSSLDVVHGFYVRDFHFSQYAQPGVVNKFDFKVNKVGEFQTQCTQMCGLYHSLMYFKVKTIPASDYHQCLTSSNSGDEFVACANKTTPALYHRNTATQGATVHHG